MDCIILKYNLYFIVVLDDFEDAPNYYKRLTEDIVVNEALNDDIKLNEGDVLPCSTYQLTNFKSELMNFKFYNSYNSTTAPRYTEM